MPDDASSGRVGGTRIPVVARESERADLADVLDHVRAGEGRSLVVIGAAGIGKSTLLEHAVLSAKGLRVSQFEGVATEVSLPFGGIQQIVRPFLSSEGKLPVAQRRALDAALGGMRSWVDLDVFLVGQAVLGLLSVAAASSPVLIVVDDAQWVDEESARALTFVARRVQADPIGILFGLRAGTDSVVTHAGLPQLQVGPLPDAEAEHLLRSAAAGGVDPGVATRLLAAAEGNPLALVELAGALTPDQLAGASPLPEPLPVAHGVEQLFAERVAGMDVQARQVLHLAATERLSDPAVVRAASSTLGVDDWDAAVAAAERSGLVQFGSTVQFRHPLARSAVYWSATAPERRQSHRALAEVLTDPADADRSAWHLGLATVERDEDVAGRLSAAADRARARGAASISAALLRRSAELTPDPAVSAARLAEAARAELEAGRPLTARGLVEQARATAPPGELEAQLAWTDALVHLVIGDVAGALPLLSDAMMLLRIGDEEAAVGAVAAAVLVTLDAGHLAPEQALTRVVEHLSHPAAEARLPIVVASLKLGTSQRFTLGYEAAVPAWRASVVAAAASPQLEVLVGRHVHVVCFDAVLAAADLLDDGAWAAVTTTWVQLARRTGALSALPIALSLSSWLQILEGRVRTAASELAEIDDMISVAGRPGLLGSPICASVLLSAWQGEDRATRDAARQTMRDAHERGEGRAIDQAQHALLVLELGLGRYEAALRIARKQVERDGVGTGTLALADLVESASRTGEYEVARDALERLGRRASAADTSWALGLHARSRALLAEGEDADHHFQEAIEHLAASRIATEHARTQLLYGEWLRRERRRKEARDPLHEALELFEPMGAAHFAERARQELAATGERVSRRPDAVALLTPQEAQIARQAAAGDRNAEIAAQLFITTSTVEYHLRKIFVKLGVRSRTELAALDLPT